LSFVGKKGQYVWTEGRDEESISRGVYNTYTSHNLRYSQVYSNPALYNYYVVENGAIFRYYVMIL